MERIKTQGKKPTQSFSGICLSVVTVFSKPSSPIGGSGEGVRLSSSGGGPWKSEAWLEIAIPSGFEILSPGTDDPRERNRTPHSGIRSD